MAGKISIVINADTRPGCEAEKTTQGLMAEGTRSYDYITHGINNKIIFFEGHGIEINLFIDIHQPVPEVIKQKFMPICDNVFFHIHSKYHSDMDYYPKWLDINLLQALYMARGEYIVHFDGDAAAFRGNISPVSEWLDLLDSGKYTYISYPSSWSPLPAIDPDFDYSWASTRFFICRRSALDFTEIEKCLRDADYLYGKYGDRKRRCPWLEHILGLTCENNKVFYPPMSDHYTIFTWSSYTTGLYEHLQRLPFNEVAEYVNRQGGVKYPCDVNGGRLP